MVASNWDKDLPAVTTHGDDSCDLMQANWGAIEDFAKKEHSFISTFSPVHSAGECSVMAIGPTITLRALTPVPCAFGWDTTLKDFIIWTALTSAYLGGFVPSSTKMLFYQDTAPAGWTIDSTVNDKVAYITSGDAQTGGQIHTTGSWVITGFSGTTASHVLCSDEMPSHRHTWAGGIADGTVDGNPAGGGPSTTTLTATVATGGGIGHTHTLGSSMRLSGEGWVTVYYNSATATYTTVTTSAAEIDSVYFPTNLIGADTDPSFLYIGVKDQKFLSLDFIVGAASGATAAILSACISCAGQTKVLNGTFSADDEWTKGTGWTIAAGVAKKAAGTAASLDQDIGVLPNGTVYHLIYTIPTIGDGALTPYIGGVAGTARYHAGTFEETIISSAGNQFIKFLGSSTLSGTLDNITIYVPDFGGVTITDNTADGGKPFGKSGSITVDSDVTSWTNEDCAASPVAGERYYWLRLNSDVEIAGATKCGDMLKPSLSGYVSAPWRPASLCCIICTKN